MHPSAFPCDNGRTGVGIAPSFHTFFRHLQSKADFDVDNTCVYHVCLPGHPDGSDSSTLRGAAALVEGTNARAVEADGDSKAAAARTTSSKYKYPGVQALCTAVSEVRPPPPRNDGERGNAFFFYFG